MRPVLAKEVGMIIYDDLLPGIAFFLIGTMMIGMGILAGPAREAKRIANWKRERRD